MTKEDVFRLFGIEDIRDLPEAAESLIFGDREKRDETYKELLRLNDYDMGREWFQGIYEAEMSERKQKKQDFTPHALGVLSARIALNEDCTVYEPTAGNGSMLIAAWWENARKKLPFDYWPSRNMVEAWELSARSIPLLLLNMSVRGMMGYVYHGDVLEKTVKQKYILLNRHDDALGFSDVLKVGMGTRIVPAPIPERRRA